MVLWQALSDEKPLDISQFEHLLNCGECQQLFTEIGHIFDSTKPKQNSPAPVDSAQFPTPLDSTESVTALDPPTTSTIN